MSRPLALIGDAVVEVIGISPIGFAETMEAKWPGKPVFGGETYYQPTALGDHRETLHLATRPHVFGGLENYRALQRQCQALVPVPFIRMSGLVGGYMGLVAIETVSKEEQRIAPDGAGWRWEFTVELLYVGGQTGVGF